MTVIFLAGLATVFIGIPYANWNALRATWDFRPFLLYWYHWYFAPEWSFIRVEWLFFINAYLGMLFVLRTRRSSEPETSGSA